MSWVWDNSPVGGTERLVLLAIADCAADDGSNAWPSIATLARKTRVDSRTVQRVIRRLADDGHLLVNATTGGRKSNTYTVVMAGPDPRQPAIPGDTPPPADDHRSPGPVPRQPRRSSVTRTSFTHPGASSRASAGETSPRINGKRTFTPRALTGAALPVAGIEQCPRHRGSSATNCGPCRSEALAGGR
ncbi:helix-turn-helix domain-containing protein [Micromonospora sp. DT68]|uniref:helix-turn-helix domain-containing protein n=1 Tax=Micromonospora sp. DT68 TaxID=3416522 RepID=UPI003CF3C322